MTTLIALNALVSAVATDPVGPIPKAALTEPTIQAATMTYSNDTTPSWSVRRCLNVSVNLTPWRCMGEQSFVGPVGRTFGNEAVGAIQFMAQTEGGIPTPPLQCQTALSNGRSESAGDSGDPASKRGCDCAACTGTERSDDCADDASRDDDVLE